MGEEVIPNPGSHEAVEKGCLCPVLDNNYGQIAPWPENGWWITDDCPLHGGVIPWRTT